MPDNSDLDRRPLSPAQPRAERGVRRVYIWLSAWAILAPMLVFGPMAVAALFRPCDDPQYGDRSPEGQQLALSCSSDAANSADIYVMNADGSGQKNLTNNHGQREDLSPEWSPDGRLIKFWGDVNDIYVVNPDGSGLKNLTGDLNISVYPGSWSPDSRKIVFDTATGYADDIYVMNADGNGLSNLTTDLAGDSHDPVWSPGGQQIAFDHGPDDDDAVYVVDADGSGLKKLVDNLNLASLDWSPGGEQIAVVSNKWVDYRHYDGELYVVNHDGSNLKLLASLPYIWDWAWSPDGQQIAFWSMSGSKADLYVVDISGSASPEKVIGIEGDEAHLSLAWSPQGRQIAWGYSSLYQDSELYLINVDGSGLKHLARVGRETEAQGPSLGPIRWSPDGATMYFDGYHYEINADGTNLRDRLHSRYWFFLLPVLAHLILLLGLLSPYPYVRWHTGQALVLAGLSILMTLLFIGGAHSPSYLQYVWVLVNGWLCLLGALWGLRQSKRGDCWLMRWFSKGEALPRPWAIPPEPPVISAVTGERLKKSEVSGGARPRAIVIATAIFLIILVAFPVSLFLVVFIVSYVVPVGIAFRETIIFAVAGAILLTLAAAIFVPLYWVARKLIGRL